VHVHIADLQRFLVHPQRNEHPNDLVNGEGRDRVKHDDEERGYRLVFELREIAIVPARGVDAGRVLVGADVEKHVGIGQHAGQETAHESCHAVTLHVAIAIATNAIIVRGQRWPWYAALALGAIGSIGAAQHGDLVAKPNQVFLGRRVLAGRAGARTRNKRRHPCRCLLHFQDSAARLAGSAAAPRICACLTPRRSSPMLNM
jgi:hypothetical protein